MASSASFAACEQEIVAACAQHELAHAQKIDYRRCIPFIIDDTRYFVKFGDTLSFASEAATQKELSKAARSDQDAPRVPAIHHIFAHEHLTYAVMEFVETAEVPMEALVQKVAAAVLWLRRQPAPPGVALGPLGGGRAWHRIFKDSCAPLPFTSSAALERFLNKAISSIRRRQPSIADISIADEPLVLTQSDMDPSNFGVDTAGRPVIFDFGQIGWLPESLANHSLLGTSPFASGVSAGVLGDGLRSVVESSNVKSLGAVRVFLGTTFSHDLGPFDSFCSFRMLTRHAHRPGLQCESEDVGFE
ncbi:uncharacterized protein SCHCODRAFT_02666503 [Schizophyllum commune H4-8]|uniref:Aminoglycoside phosphotransferase domain-containing protein n=1 Tax=Schizophyllum commune (strain H4-8 / FGSC 9210) TaxID=578458 RepID=D8PPE9_SCHCM|nr:uncharacterized protein SCHCODRAFT_02666503 [Schizophyllum commune H4-8]KAI5893396.1 hypothetical protein SCHCODRAFT_02666503 [Schizophyllum commune H4-8]